MTTFLLYVMLALATISLIAVCFSVVLPDQPSLTRLAVVVSIVLASLVLALIVGIGGGLMIYVMLKGFG